MAVGACLAAGTIEEFTFRVYILSRLSFSLKTTLASDIFRADIHSGVLTYKNFYELIFVFVTGLIFGYQYQRYRSLTVLMIVYFATGLIAMSIYHPHK